MTATGIFPAITRWIREQSGLARGVPIWWAEMYPVPCTDTAAYIPPGNVWPVEEQIAVYTKAMNEIAASELKAGVLNPKLGF